MSNRLSLVWLALAASFAYAGPEPWADPKLPVRDGLEMWLDASRANGEKPADGKLARWLDASGHGRHLKQDVAASQPTLVKLSDATVVRFDGQAAHLRAIKQAAELKAFTVFVVAAPKENPGMFRGLLAFNAANQRDYVLYPEAHAH